MIHVYWWHMIVDHGLSWFVMICHRFPHENLNNHPLGVVTFYHNFPSWIPKTAAISMGFSRHSYPHFQLNPSKFTVKSVTSSILNILNQPSWMNMFVSFSHDFLNISIHFPSFAWAALASKKTTRPAARQLYEVNSVLLWPGRHCSDHQEEEGGTSTQRVASEIWHFFCRNKWRFSTRNWDFFWDLLGFTDQRSISWGISIFGMLHFLPMNNGHLLRSPFSKRPGAARSLEPIRRAAEAGRGSGSLCGARGGGIGIGCGWWVPSRGWNMARRW